MSLEDAAERLRTYMGDVDPSRAKGRKRVAILEAAHERFVAQGYRETSMDEIAVAVGVAKGTLYLYFPRKIDLLIACIAREKLALVPMLARAFDEGLSAQERLKQWLVVMLTWPAEAPLNTRIVEGELAEVMAEIPAELMGDSKALRTDLLAPLLDAVAGDHRWSAVELQDRAYVVAALGVLAPAIRQEWIRPGMTPQRFAMILADLVVDGLRPRSEHGQTQTQNSAPTISNPNEEPS
ncbi:TetR/AcrR family transcriptional regulator [Pseudenhygromyxa sp. WMMC2535]|uniref:TetR/AcrR family transcriptional regulator n=1 Tax=Pseudenhygromyxa sp. WMMC2535 TaxID=2712867 RepID=UPI0020D17C1D|nr:TetR/AcrR family transcriptional regulator [Pseudenhygromyxa sp. WMMC2535]